jgi:hypothetical protein
MTFNIKKLMSETLPTEMKRHSEKLKTVDGRFQIEITGIGSWYIGATSDEVVCLPTVKDADCTITATSNEFQNLLRNPAFNGPRLCCLGRIKITGNQAAALKLPQIYSICGL